MKYLSSANKSTPVIVSSDGSKQRVLADGFPLSVIPNKASATLTQIFYYCCIGMSLNGINYLLYLFATHHHVTPKVSMTVLYIIGIISSTLANRKWVFFSEGRLLALIIRAAIAYLCGYLINLFLLYWFVDLYGYPHQLIQLFAIGVVAVFLFFTLKFFVF